MSKTYLVTGGSGFIGSNYVNRLLARGEKVKVFDNLSRNGSQHNLAWLRQTHGEKSFEFIQADVRDETALVDAAKDADVITHFAAQVAVTSSVTDPRSDFEINALGTFNALEAARKSKRSPSFIFTSTNKVYGGMEDMEIEETATRYKYANLPEGVSEERGVDFHSPYGCSKGAADQYVRDYSRIYDIPTSVLRLSCIYGTRQFGIEDQGWVAWFLIRSTLNEAMSIYGDGKQVRDLLFVDDLMDAFDAVISNPDKTAGQILNLGGGNANSISVWGELGPMLEELFKRKLNVSYADWRPGDQRIFVSDIRKAKKVLNWSPKVDVKSGVHKLFDWIQNNKNLFA